MPNQKKQIRVSLRLESDFYGFLVGVADDLGIGINDLFNLLIRRSLGAFQVSRHDMKQSNSSTRTLVSMQIHAELDDQLQLLGDNRNLLITHMLHHALPEFVVEARVYKEYVLTRRYEILYGEWHRLRPAASVREFDAELRKLLSGETSDLSEMESPAPPVPIPSPIRHRTSLPDVEDP